MERPLLHWRASAGAVQLKDGQHTSKSSLRTLRQYTAVIFVPRLITGVEVVDGGMKPPAGSAVFTFGRSLVVCPADDNIVRL